MLSADYGDLPSPVALGVTKTNPTFRRDAPSLNYAQSSPSNPREVRSCDFD